MYIDLAHIHYYQNGITHYMYIHMLLNLLVSYLDIPNSLPLLDLLEILLSISLQFIVVYLMNIYMVSLHMCLFLYHIFTHISIDNWYHFLLVFLLQILLSVLNLYNYNVLLHIMESFHKLAYMYDLMVIEVMF